MGAGLYRPRGCKFGQWPPVSPVQSQLGREGLGAQTFPLPPPGGTFHTNLSMRHRSLLPSPRVGQPGPLRQLASCLCLWRPVSCPGSRWMFSCPGSRWTFSHPDQRSVGFHPDAFQRLQLPGSQSGSTSVGEVIRLVRLRVHLVPDALGGVGRPGAGPTVPVSRGSSLRALSIL